MFSVLIYKGGITSGGVVFILLAVVYGPWLLLLYLVIGGMVAAKSHSTTDLNSAENGGAELLPKANVVRWRNHVKYLKSVGFSSPQIEENLVSRGVSENDAKVIVSQLLREM